MILQKSIQIRIIKCFEEEMVIFIIEQHFCYGVVGHNSLHLVIKSAVKLT